MQATLVLIYASPGNVIFGMRLQFTQQSWYRGKENMTILRSASLMYIAPIAMLLSFAEATLQDANAAANAPQKASAASPAPDSKQSQPTSSKSEDDTDEEDADVRDKKGIRKKQPKTGADTSDVHENSSKSVQVSGSDLWKKDSRRTRSKNALPDSFFTDTEFNRRIVEKVDRVVSKRLYSKTLADTVWKDAISRKQNEILKSKNLEELRASVGSAIAELKSSHCNFVTTNDEMYHFLHSLFSDFNKKMDRGKTDYIGFVTGGKPYLDNQIRYVLDGSPASRAGLEIGDRILKVDGLNYVGYSHFLGRSGNDVAIEFERKGTTKTTYLKPEMSDLYGEYVKAMHNSVRIEQVNGKKIGYVHVWCGGGKSHNALEEIMEEKLSDTDGLILDIRDGYGGNSLTDLDRFYRNKVSFPDFVTVDRNGKKSVGREYYEKPMVAIINGGSRSGKELVAFSLKRSGRAKLVGTTTAGAVLAGSLRPIDDRASVYIAVLDGTVDGVRLEGTGVAPDIEIENTSHDKAGYDQQLSAAQSALMELIKAGAQN